MSWIRYLIAFALLMHGLAHFSGFFAAWTKADVGYPAKPWLFSKNVNLKSPIGKIFETRKTYSFGGSPKLNFD